MKLSDWASVAEIVSGIAVVVTLVLLLFGIRDNTRAINSASFQAATDALVDINLQVASNEKLAALMASSTPFQEMDPPDQVQYSFLLLAYFRVLETSFYQRNQGTHAAESWLRQEYTLKNQLRSASFRDWWSAGQYGFTPEFTTYVDDLISAAPADRSSSIRTSSVDSESSGRRDED